MQSGATCLQASRSYLRCHGRNGPKLPSAPAAELLIAADQGSREGAAAADIRHWQHVKRIRALGLHDDVWLLAGQLLALVAATEVDLSIGCARARVVSATQLCLSPLLT